MHAERRPQKVLTTISTAQQTPAAPVQTSAPLVAPAPVIPSQNMQQLLQPPREHSDMNGVNAYQSQFYPAPAPAVPAPAMGYHSNYSVPATSVSLPPGVSPELLNAIPEEQKVGHCRQLSYSSINRFQAMLLQVLSMSPAQIELLPPTERATFTQLVSISS